MSYKAKALNVHGVANENDEDSLTSPCFQIDANVELKEVPTTGEEYLLKVIKERQKCLVVTKCKKDLTMFAKNQSRFATSLPPVKTAPQGLKPTIEWQNIQEADFSKTRMYVSKMHCKKSAWPHTVTKITFNTNDSVSWKQFFEDNPPSLSSVLGHSQELLNCGLEVHVQSLQKIKNGDTIDPKTGQWIYSLLACIELPLLSDTISLLRDLARKCAEIRSHLNVANETAILDAAPLNLFICLVSRYFRQTDLAD